MNLIAFDLEIAKDIPEGTEDWRELSPLGITCAVTWASNEDEPRVWTTPTRDGHSHMPKMGLSSCIDLVYYLKNADGVPVTWNGLSFDFNVLAQESGMHKECEKLARLHYDMMFQIFCIRGHYLGLNKAAQGAGLAGKTEGVTGSDAPQMWRDGKHQEVIDYCIQDVKVTLDLAKWIEENRRVVWTANSGRINSVTFPAGLESVGACLTISRPNTSWMDNPPTRESFYSWF